MTGFDKRFLRSVLNRRHDTDANEPFSRLQRLLVNGLAESASGREISENSLLQAHSTRGE
jgi:hypothetical protein